MTIPRFTIPLVDIAEPVGFPEWKDPALERVEKERMTWELEVVSWMEYGLRKLHAEQFLEPGFAINVSLPPYTVPCPHCLAFALEPCRHESRRGYRVTFAGRIPGPWPATSRMLRAPHPARHQHWEAHPEYRVTPLP